MLPFTPLNGRLLIEKFEFKIQLKLLIKKKKKIQLKLMNLMAKTHHFEVRL